MMAEPSFQVLSWGKDEGGCTKPQVRRYQKRKTHAKSKAGCLSCKVKRVKCDEAKPQCGRCQRSGAPCTFPSNNDSSPPSIVVKRKQPSSQTLSPASSDSSLSVFPPSARLGQSASPYGTPRVVLLKHFSHVFNDLQGFGAQFPEPVIALGLTRPHLLDAMLAVSASHLRYHTAAPARHRVAEHFQQSLAVRGLQTALAEPLDQSGSDALLLTSMLLNLLAFSIVGNTDNPYDSWVFSECPQRLSWFSLILGYKPLLLSTSRYHGEGTMLQWMFQASDDDQRTFNGDVQPLSRVPPPWLNLCGLLPEDDTEDNLFHEPLRILAEIRQLEPRPEHYFLYVALIGKLDFEFRDLLEADDERAMWVLGYWFGLMRRYNYWWMRNRMQLDHRAVILWLELRGVKNRRGWEGEMWSALMYDLEAAPTWFDCSDVDRDVVEITP